VLRRSIFSAAGWAMLLEKFAVTAQAAAMRIGPDIYQSIGVKPIINCKGTFTLISGSQSLPAVKAAMEAASRHYVHLDELMEAAGKRLAELTGAEWGMVSNGCAAALSHATAACIAGADPEKAQRLPHTAGIKNEIISPAYSRNVYDHAIRGAGGKFVTVNSKEELERAFNKNTAMVMILAGPGDDGPLGTRVVSAVAKQHGVPVLVDAAAERLKVPNVHLAAGADLVAYSGGKCLRGPQAAGLLLGRKDVVKAAWMHSAPHHAFGRPMKAGKEEVMGMLAAVEMWMKRDHNAEWKEWEGWIEAIGKAAARVDGVTYKIRQPNSLSNNAPQVQVMWDGEKIGLGGQELEKLLLDGEPRIIVGGAAGGRRTGIKDSSITIMPYMMMPGDAKIAAERIHGLLSKPPKIDRPAVAAPSVNVNGQWDAELTYVLGKSQHKLAFEQTGAQLVGSHQGEYIGSDLRGTVEGDEVWFRSSHPYEGTRVGYEFTGKVAGDAITGTVDLNEYGKAQFTARRHQYGGGRRR